MAKKVFLGVGHGGSDPGAVALGREEADLNLAIALACRDELERHGVDVKMSRTKDENDTIDEEIGECNAYGPDLAIDIHNNAGKGDGAEAYYYTGGGTSKILAINVLDEIVKTGQNSRGAKPNVINGIKEYFGFIRETVAPAIIVECAFVDNAEDIKIIDTTTEQKAMGRAVAKGILTTLGIAHKADTVKPVTVNSVNGTRWDNHMVLYAGKNSTGANKWGVEVAFDKTGTATTAPERYKGNMTIPEGGFVLSGHGTAATWLVENIQKGSKVKIQVDK